MKIRTSELQGSALDWAVAKCEGHDMEYFQVVDAYSPTTDWSQAGPIIERHCINLFRLDPKTEDDTRFWIAHIDGIYCRYGVSALIAAMRCYIASKMGDEVEVPEELM